MGIEQTRFGPVVMPDGYEACKPCEGSGYFWCGDSADCTCGPCRACDGTGQVLKEVNG